MAHAWLMMAYTLRVCSLAMHGQKLAAGCQLSQQHISITFSASQHTDARATLCIISVCICCICLHCIRWTLLKPKCSFSTPVVLAADLHTIGGLPTLLSLLQDPHASIRWRAAEVVATCVQNNPPVQQVTSLPDPLTGPPDCIPACTP